MKSNQARLFVFFFVIAGVFSGCEYRQEQLEARVACDKAYKEKAPELADACKEGVTIARAESKGVTTMPEFFTALRKARSICRDNHDEKKKIASCRQGVYIFIGLACQGNPLCTFQKFDNREDEYK